MPDKIEDITEERFSEVIKDAEVPTYPGAPEDELEIDPDIEVGKGVPDFSDWVEPDYF